MKVRALWLENGKLAFRDDVVVPKPAPDEALLRVRMAGICGTDLQLLKGYYPFSGVLGHEFVAEVVETVDDGWRGLRVVAEINIGCGTCQMCQKDMSIHCEKRRVLGIHEQQGAFAEYLVMPLVNLHPVPKTVSDESAVFVEPLAAALEIQEQITMRASDSVLVIGAGRLGQLVAQSFFLSGLKPTVVVRYENQRDILAKLGISTIWEDAIPLREMEVVVEATGSPQGFSLALKALRPRGTMILKSTYKEVVEVDVSSIVVDEITLVGSRCGPYKKALDLLKKGDIDPTPLITDRFRLEEGDKAIKRAAQPGALKVLLEP